MRIAPIAAAALLILASCGDDEEDTGEPKPECDFTEFDNLKNSGQTTGSGSAMGLMYFGSNNLQTEMIHFSLKKIEEDTYEFNIPAGYVDLFIWTGVSDASNPWENHEVEYEVIEGTAEVTDALSGIQKDKFAAVFHDVKLEEVGVEEPRVWCLEEFSFEVSIDTGP